MKEAKFSKNLLKRNKSVGINHGTSYYDKSAIVKGLMSEKKSYKKDLYKGMDLLIAGQIDKEQFIKFQKETIGKHFTSSFALGKRFNQNTEIKITDDERRFIVYQTTQEMNYMSKFADDIVSSSGKMNYKRRMNMYADGLDPMFRLGDIAYLPENIEIEWVLGITDKHCIDCLSFAKGSPYLKKTLPGIPRSGNSRCLSNCACKIIYHTPHVNTKYTNFILDNYTSRRKNVPTLAQFNAIDSMRSNYYRTRLKYELTKLDTYLDQAKVIKNELNEFIVLGEIAVVTSLYIAKPIAELKKFKNNENYDVVSEISSVRHNDIVSTFIGDTQVYGKVKAKYGTTLVIDTLFQKGIKIDVIDDIIFKEI